MEYDKTNRLIKYNGTEVKYDKDGNMVYGPLNGVMTSFIYDCRNRLIQAGTTKYEYDAEDNRTAVIKNAGTTEEIRTEYVVDSVEELSRTLMATEIKNGNKAVTYFYYGNGLLAQENAKEGYLTYHFNNVGNTNAVTDENGNVKYSYAYNPYGELTQGTYGQVMFLFNGQYGVASDDNGLYYMRARYYNVSIKRFINQDVVTGKIAESQSLNRYAYVEGNPVSYLDPFGLEKYDKDGYFQLYSGYWYKINNTGGRLKQSRDFLNVEACLSAAIDIVVNNYITGMTITEVAAEIYFHAIVYYAVLPLSEINLDKLEIAEHAGIIDFEHGGESSSVLKKLYDIYWTDAIMKKYLSI